MRASPVRSPGKPTSVARSRRRPAVDAAIAKLTTAEVNAVFRKYFKPGEFAYAFAGDFDKAR
jgi:hypothetical protein